MFSSNTTVSVALLDVKYSGLHCVTGSQQHYFILLVDITTLILLDYIGNIL